MILLLKWSGGFAKSVTQWHRSRYPESYILTHGQVTLAENGIRIIGFRRCCLILGARVASHADEMRTAFTCISFTAFPSWSFTAGCNVLNYCLARTVATQCLVIRLSFTILYFHNQCGNVWSGGRVLFRADVFILFLQTVEAHHPANVCVSPYWNSGLSPFPKWWPYPIIF